MNFPKLLRGCAPAVGVALAMGCAGAPPAPDVARRAAVAGVPEPIEFVEAEMPLDTEDWDGAATLPLNEAVRRALKSDPVVQAALADVRAALADARQARLLPNPVVSVAVRFPEGGGKAVVEAGLAADLISILSRPRRASAADHRLRAASANALTAVLDALAEVQERYAAVQAVDAQLQVLAQRKQLVVRLFDLARARLAAGESGRLDVLALDAERASLDVEITQRASERRDQRLMLARLIGEPSSAADWTLPAWTPVALAPADEASWLAAALEHRPEVQARRWELAALGDEAALARLAALDTVDVGAEAERDEDWSVGPAVAAPLPLFDWGRQRRANVRAQQVAARHRLTEARRQAVEEVRRAVESLASSQAALRQVRSELIPLADERVAHAEAAYRSGAADVTAVMLAEQEAQAARSQLIESQRAATSALHRLHRAVGGPGIAANLPSTAPPAPSPATALENLNATVNP